MNCFKLSVLLGLVSATTFANAADIEKTIVIKGHRFEPSVITIPAGQRIKLTVHNQDSTAEEFESHALRLEKVIAGGSKAVLMIRPLKPGRYKFVGEFNEETAQGVIVAE